MANDEFKNTAIATAVMAALTLLVIFLQVTNRFVFDPIFETCLFIVPLALLLGYLLVQKYRKTPVPVAPP